MTQRSWILVRATESSHGLARELPLDIVTGPHALILCNEMPELAKFLPYRRLRALQGLPETRIYDLPIRDITDIVGVQMARIGNAPLQKQK